MVHQHVAQDFPMRHGHGVILIFDISPYIEDMQVPPLNMQQYRALNMQALAHLVQVPQDLQSGCQ